MDVSADVQKYIVTNDPLPEALTKITGFMLYWVTNIAGQFYEQVAASLGLETQQIAILQLLMVEDHLVQSRLAEKLHIHKTTMVHLLNGLEAQGLVERRSYPADKRALEVYITEAGRTRGQEAERRSVLADDMFFAALSSEERQTFRTMLARIATNQAS